MIKTKIRIRFNKIRVSLLYRTAQPFILAAFLPWGSSKGAGRIGLTLGGEFSY